MDEDTTPKPKPQKKAAKKAQSANSPQAASQGSLPAWSVVTLSFLIGAGLVAAIFFTYLRGPLAVSAESDAQLRAIADRVAQLEGQKSRFDTIENSINRLETTRNALNALQEKQESDVHRLEAAINERQDPVKLNLAPLENRLGAIEQKVQAISQVEFAERERLLALALSGLALKEALDKGAPFAAEFAIIKNLLHAKSNLAALGDFADTGVPTVSSLLGRYPQAVQAMQDAQLPEDAGAWERTKNFFYKLVSVRKVGNVPGDDADSILARVEFNLQQNNSAGAYREFLTLPETMRRSSAEWGKDLAARAEADRLMRDLLLTTAQNLQQKPTKTE